MSAILEDTVFYSVCVFGVIGLLSNCVVLAVSRTKDFRQKDYIYFIINRSLVDAFASLTYFCLQPMGLLHWIDIPIWCFVAGGVSSIFQSTMVVSEPLLAFNRYVSVCRNNLYTKYFRRKYIYCMCSLTWLFGILITSPHFVLGTLGRSPGFLCNVQLLKSTSFIVYLCSDCFTSMCSYGVILFFHCKIACFLRRHQQQEMAGGQSSRLQEDKELLRCIAALGVLPLITSLPLAVCSILSMEQTESVPDFILGLANILFLCCPTMNAVSTIIIVRPMRRQLLSVVKKVFDKKQNAVTPVRPVTVATASQ